MSKRSYAWDTSVIIAWLCDEKTAPLIDIELVVQEVDKKDANLILSVTTFSEILETKYTSEQLALLEGFLKRSNVVKVETSFPVASKAGKIRDAGRAAGIRIDTPDAQIIATAILYKADVLHSLDNDMLRLNASPIVDGLAISLPRILGGQLSIPYPS